ncbi:decapping and exoribonuclease protein-like [Cydia pomonella]|uniref:decapping and exoribonuclease protein-like n=1 Tax=Cydia pomonella TaxID=82600 RepID=UPI002ADD3FCA|nr:decapping and exoribonuclease protein-like [Cydia pomonella]
MQPELPVTAERFCGNFPNFRRPTVIGYIGLENLKYARKINNTKVNFDLNVQLENAIHKPEGLDVKLNDLLQFLLEHEARLNMPRENKLQNARFFCYRGLMTCVACTPYENKEPWKIVVMLFKGNIFLCARDTEEKIKRVSNMTQEEKKFTSWGYKFEQYILSDTPDTEPNPNIPVDETEEFSLIFKTHLNQHSIIYGAEMDGICCNNGRIAPPPTTEIGADAIVQYLSTKEFIELKTSKQMEHPRQEASFRRFKTKKWWCQSFLVGIDTVLCGFRDDAGIVKELKTYRMRDLTRMSQRYWNPNVCFNFLDAFLSYVKRCLASVIRQKHGDNAVNNLQALPLISILLEWRPGMPVQLAGDYCHEDDTILHEWFTSKFGKFDKSTC